MTEQSENKRKDITLYSMKAINGATFLGGPLAAGYMIGENFKALGQRKKGLIALAIGIVATLVIFSGLLLAPSNIVDRIPNQLLPAFYTAIVWGIVEWQQGDILKTHKASNNSFFSGWRAAGIGLSSLIILGIGIFGYALLSPDEEILRQYDEKIAQFSENEDQTLVFYDHLSISSDEELLSELSNQVIPKWKENIEIINSTDELGKLPPELVEQNEVLLKYAELRLKAFYLFYRSILEDTDEYSSQLDLIHIQIENELKKL